MTYPDVGSKFFEPFTEEELENLWIGVCKELADPAYLKRTHHIARTYKAGCRGPLCAKAARDYQREALGNKAQKRFEYERPVLMFFMLEAKRKIEEHQANLFEMLIS